MASCCPSPSAPLPEKITTPCPECGITGRTVANTTVRTIVAPSGLVEVGERDQNLCMTLHCPVSYYSESTTLHEKDLRVPLWCKDDSNDRVVCYCHQVKAADILGEMRRNPEAQTFADIQRIFSLSNCDCAATHPLGGSCACAGDIGKVVKLGRKLLDASEPNQEKKMQLQVKKVESTAPRPALFLYEAEMDCCGNSAGKPLFEFLDKRCSAFAEVKHVNLSSDAEEVPAPAAVLQALQAHGPAALPLLYFDGEVLFSGEIPNFLNAMGIINKRRRKS